MSTSTDNELVQDSVSRYSDDSNVVSSDSESQSSESSGDEYSDEKSSGPSETSGDDSPIVVKKRIVKPRIISSGEESGGEGQTSNNNSNVSNGSLERSTHASNKSLSNSTKSNSTSALNATPGANLSTNSSKSSSNNTSLANASNNLKSFVDENLFADEIQNSKHSTMSEIMDTRNSSRISGSRSLGKSFSKHRSRVVSSSSSEEDEDESTNSTSNVKRRTSSSNKSTADKQDPSYATDEENFEKEFQKNIYSPRTRMSITGIRRSIDSSNSEDELVDDTVQVSNAAMGESITIPDSDDEGETNDSSIMIIDDDDEPPTQQSLKTSFAQNPLRASSPKPKPEQKPMRLQPKITTHAKEFVSQDFYDKQVMKLNDLENELHKSVQLRGAFQVKLPDDGRRLSGRISRLQLDIERQQAYIGTLIIQTSFHENEIKPDTSAAKKKVIELSWDDLDAATNEVKPKYTGTVGLKNFNMQKVMTLDTLKEIHGSLSSCPKSDTLADDPSGLNIELMPHQKYAIAWLKWRETQRPRGGILADDMGLGKTLTLIAHVLAANQSKENESDDNSDEDDDNENPHKGGWTAKGRKDFYDGGTLVVCPASLIGQWSSEIKNRVKRNLLNVILHHGPNRDVKARHIAKADIVITTYQIVVRECDSNGPLANVKWDRVILDEAHVIRNHKSRMSISVCQLNRRKNWILTGTPIQNKEMDVYALFKFLKCEPFDDLNHFKKWIDNKNAGGQLRLNTILKAIMLRRTKTQLISEGGLQSMPNKELHIVDVTLEKEEMNVYQKIMLYSKTLFAQYLHQRADKDDGMQNFKKRNESDAFYKAHKMLVEMHGAREVKSHEILVLLLRLRQICVHPGLITAMLEDEDRSNVFEEGTSENDSIDIDLMEQLNNLNIKENDSGSLEMSAEICNNSRVSKASQKVLLKSNPVYDFSRPSSKFKKMLDVLNKEVLSKNENAVIVSQWTHVLEIIGMTFRRNGISCTSLTGSVPVKDRGAIVDNFNKKCTSSKVLLLSLTAGGVGLNLVGGNHLFLVDLHWNPQLEAQAQDRVYRVGQTKTVHIYKFVCNSTIEQRIQLLQEKKLEIANGVLTGSKTEGSKLTIDDLKSLFEI